jgi:uncharacterized protein HemX
MTPTAPYPHVSDPTMSSPTAGYPQLGGVRPAEPKKSKATPILGALLALTVVAAAVFAFLYVQQKGRADDAAQASTSQSQRINELNSQLKKSNADLTAAKNDLSSVNSQLKAAQDGSKACADSVQAFVDALDSNDETQANQAAVTMFDKCEVDLT